MINQKDLDDHLLHPHHHSKNYQNQGDLKILIEHFFPQDL